MELNEQVDLFLKTASDIGKRLDYDYVGTGPKNSKYFYLKDGTKCKIGVHKDGEVIISEYIGPGRTTMYCNETPDEYISNREFITQQISKNNLDILMLRQCLFELI